MIYELEASVPICFQKSKRRLRPVVAPVWLRHLTVNWQLLPMATGRSTIDILRGRTAWSDLPIVLHPLLTLSPC